MPAPSCVLGPLMRARGMSRAARLAAPIVAAWDAYVVCFGHAVHTHGTPDRCCDTGAPLPGVEAGCPVASGDDQIRSGPCVACRFYSTSKSMPASWIVVDEFVDRHAPPPDPVTRLVERDPDPSTLPRAPPGTA